MTRKIALLLLAVAVILATLRLVLTSGNDAPSPQDVSVERNDAGARATGESADLALVGGPDQSTREASAVPSPASTDVAPQAAVDDGVERRRLVVRVEMNDGGTPPDELEVFALERGVPGGVLANAVSSTPAPPSADGPSVFDELDDPRNERVAVLSAVLARATVTGDVDDGWTALLEIPAANRRVFVHAYGDGAFTFRATEVFQDSEVITLRPGRGASLRVAVGLGDDARGARLDETRARLGVSADAATLMAMGATAAAEFGVSVDLDDAGVATFATVPAGVELRLRLSNDGFAAIEETVPALEHGETRELELTASRGATIRGRVVDDEGLPIGGAKVTGARPGRMFGFDDSKVTEATSAEDGTFSLERLPDGVAIVRADSETALQSSRLRVSIEDGRDAEGVEIVLEKGKAISGIARFASGVVAAGIDVRARFDVSHIAGPSGMAATRGIEASATTDGEGRFRLTGLGNGPFSVRASGSPGSDDATEWLARLDGVRPGAENLALELHPPLQVAGLVRDEAGTPLASVDVLASRVVPGSMGDMRLDWRGTTTDEEGRFTVEGVVTGNWALSVATLEYVTLEDVHLDVDGPVDDASLVAVRTGTIRGRVVGPDGSPLEGARVEQRADRPDWMAALSREVETARTRSNDDGTFLLLGVRPGKVVVAATSDELSPAQTDALDVDPGGTLEDVELRLMNGGAIEGIVFEDDGSPASGRVVQVQSPTLAVMRPVSTGDDGTFEIRGLPAGSYQLVAMDPSTDMSGDMDAGGIASMLESIDMATADVVEGETVIVYIGAPPADPVEVSGRVEQGGEPFTGAMVVWMPASESMYERMKMTTTDEDGNYRLTLDEPGDYMVSVARMGGSTGQQETVEFSESIPDDTAEFERDFEVPGGTIAGRGGGARGRPVPGARRTKKAPGAMRSAPSVGGSYGAGAPGA
ncbi:MAG: carboxypeptidase-like regulatory domain-containing protein, partial [Planctomycetota bacterium]